MPHDTPLLATLAAALLAAWVLGLIAQRLRFSPIVGYLLAGVVIGPHTPGFVGDIDLASQLAEVGVVLLMFGVGLHFHLNDLMDVKRVAIPGAIIQSTAATLMGLGIGVAFGWPATHGLVLGMALSVASTVVLLRGLESHNLASSPSGHVAIGWLIVEDILTVVVLVVIPALAATGGAAMSAGALAQAMALALARLAVLVVLVFLVGSRAIPWLLVKVARLQSRELFTLTILAITVAIASGAAVFFGASVALGAFLAGMVVGQTKVSQQAAADALPLRDAFAVLFFVSVGMLFEPAFAVREPTLLLASLAVVLVGKPLAAVLVVAVLGYSTRTALVVAVGLAQVGEFSFILGALARHHDLLSETGYNLLVACALVSISLNPFLFRGLDAFESALRRRPWLWNALNAVATRRAAAVNAEAGKAIAAGEGPLAIIVGFGPVGQAVDRGLRHAGIETVVVDLNMDTIGEVARKERLAIYGDAAHDVILEAAGIRRATQLIVALPHSINRIPLMTAARQLNSRCKIFIRARYIRERDELVQGGAYAACFEEAEAAVALTQGVLADLGIDPATIAKEIDRVRAETTGAPVATMVPGGKV
ncbi:MAG TPA: cation:proton antiporter [Vicinamibacteria bacterium]|nr:cation:proton antiporter [Vicinamibacteria bacterium]HRB13548.1 cation:proton antiporter [Vicinamibacteria bacterium]